MKIVVMIAAGLGLFVATVVGLLASQGRLSYEGTKGIPLLHGLFEPPQGEDGNGEVSADDAPGSEKPAEVEPGVHIEGLGKEEQREYRVGPGVGDVAPDGPKKLATEDDAHGEDQAHGEPGARPEKGQGHEETSHGGGGRSHGEAESGKEAADSEFRSRQESLLGQGQDTRGKLFEFPRLKARMSVQDVNRILEQALAEKQAAERERVVLAQRSAELDARETDLRDREERILEQMREIEQSRAQLNERIEQFRSQVILVDEKQKEDLEADAKTLAAFEPERASELLLEWWKRSETDKAKVVRILSVMKADAADQILQIMEVSQAREILDMRAKVIRLDQKGK